jgi:endonuclease/exonuclease/phosphatase family metal-dependent hydrolase
LLRLTRRLAAGAAPTVIAGDLNMPGPVSGLVVGYSPAVQGPTFPAHRRCCGSARCSPAEKSRARDGRVLPPAGSDHLPIRARLRVV